ncbi:MAG: Rne/Rng family ribonuclease [Rickettsiaceae bacterium]|nr:Rne/Rng family ribonuclease [Rickettsiaceae bacterium]
MNKKILIDGTFPNQFRVALVGQNNKIENIEYQSSSASQIKGNIYLAKVARIEPGLQAAFIDYGSGKNGFLPFSEIHPGYYNIPIGDVEKYSNELSNLQSISEPTIANVDPSLDETCANFEENDAETDISTIEKIIDTDSSTEKESYSQEEESDKLNDEAIEPIALYKQYQIQEVIKKGQVILVQATKEERGNKGASFTSYISLAGKYSVLMPNNPGHIGVSRRISSGEERKRLKRIIESLLGGADAKIASLIVRTAGTGKSSGDIKRDYEYLVRLWNHIRELTLVSRAPALIHAEEEIIQKSIRDLFDSSVSNILIEGEEAYLSAVDCMSNILPEEINKISRYNDDAPIFSKFDVESQIASLYQQTVILPSGGYIIINPTEALTSIDVNSGKSTSERTIEQTALKTNVEAAKEIARQLRIRDISGLIVIDFIDMHEHRNRKIVERSLGEYVARDKAKIHLGNISSFGLFEMSRQRLRQSFLESHSKMCQNCNGKGIVRNEEANSMLILRTIENEVYNQKIEILNVYAHNDVVLFLLNNKRVEISLIEKKYSMKLNFYFDNEASSDSFSIEKVSIQDTPYQQKKYNKTDIGEIENLHELERVQKPKQKKNDATITEQKNNDSIIDKGKKSSKRRNWKSDHSAEIEEVHKDTDVSSESGNNNNIINDQLIEKPPIKKNKKRLPRKKRPKAEQDIQT